MEQLLIGINRLRADMQLYAFARLFFHYYSEILLSGFLVNFRTIIKPVIEYENDHIRQEANLLNKIKQSQSCQVFFVTFNT